MLLTMSQVMCVNFLLRDIANLGHGRLLRYHHAHPPSLPPCPPPRVTSRWLICTCAQRPVVQAECVRGHDERHGPARVQRRPQLRHLAVRLHCEQRRVLPARIIVIDWRDPGFRLSSALCCQDGAGLSAGPSAGDAVQRLGLGRGDRHDGRLPAATPWPYVTRTQAHKPSMRC